MVVQNSPGGHQDKKGWETLVEETHVLAVLGLGEVDEVLVVHVLSAKQVTVVRLAQVLRVDPVGPQELLVCHAEGLTDGLGYELGLWAGIKALNQN